ncbi:MAG: PH domain-containing protein [Pseudomonadota bacterium]
MDTTLSPSLSPQPPTVGAQALGAMDDENELTKVDPAYVTALRINAVLTSIPFIIGSLVLEGVIAGESPMPFGVIIGLVVFLALVFVIRFPSRRWQARGYNMSEDRLRVVRGVLWHSDTVVPFGRVQHIDVDQGPIERALGIATLTLHTAGNHNASVFLPGLKHELATDMRETIRERIKRDTL